LFVFDLLLLFGVRVFGLMCCVTHLSFLISDPARTPAATPRRRRKQPQANFGKNKKQKKV
jgi:hypothetical protein